MISEKNLSKIEHWPAEKTSSSINKTSSALLETPAVHILDDTLDSIPDMISIHDNNHKIIHVNSSMAKFIGKRPEECIGLSCFRCIHRLPKPHQFCPHSLILKDGKEHSAEIYDDVSGKYLLIITTPLFDKRGKITGSIHIVRDISKQTKEFTELEMVSRFPSEDPSPVLRVAYDGRIMYANKASRMLLRQWKADNDDISRILGHLFSQVKAAIRSKKSKEVEIEASEHVFVVSIVPIVEYGYVNLYGKDVTKKKLIEKKLLESNEEIKRAQSVASIGGWRFDATNDEFHLSEEACRMIGLSKEEKHTKKEFITKVHPDDRALIIKTWDLAMRNGHFDIELRIIVSGDVRWVRLLGDIEIDSRGKSHDGFGVVQDITEQKRKDDLREQLLWELRKQKNILSTVLENTETNLAYLDNDFNIIDVNAAYANESNMKKSSMIGKNWFDVFPEDKNQELFELAKKTGKVMRLKANLPTSQKSNGEPKKYWDWTMVCVRDSKKKPDGFVISQHNVTAEILWQKKLEAALNEKESLIKEIHHRVKNNLQIISSMLNLQSKKSADPSIQFALKESKNRVKSISLVHELLYKSESLAKIKMQTYVRDLKTYILDCCNQKTNVNVRFDVDDLIFSTDDAISCGLIINELVTNSLKHAFDNVTGGNITIRLKKHKQKIELCVIDDGSGFPDGANIKKTDSLGLQLVSTFVAKLNGEIDITNKEGGSVRITFPMNNDLRY
ncbi:hypothetical protein COV93_05120 [Candidatus Woesearchaeota archaeon CG11_big_fil_rev_8_21_14_0_20_43_8]|nr:MAG: hypothetical protein COV93_05120 [Candidatus Woesearchaeota archaeon CG11_big_fil_rev_8_21_14_0_20_43_8]PIO04576.1 MAG: hypothetical protein COT47_08410 [Candidatus Woesearchaeota archaeon CG08_land_8_20_14_0_20_43_7]